MCGDFATVLAPLRLERPGIEPGAERCISPSVDAIEAPQPLPITRLCALEKAREPARIKSTDMKIPAVPHSKDAW
ncbi:MAG TPA: hypothetical protein VIW73_02690, partial [Candidatus Cybelea sp.]